MLNLRDLTPPILRKLARKLLVTPTWVGRYDSWRAVREECRGYEHQEIAERVLEAALQVQNGKAAFERDSVLFHKPSYSPLWISAFGYAGAKQNQVPLRVVDFGGSLGSGYFRYRKIWPKSFSWTVLEQDLFCKLGRQHLANDQLRFETALTTTAPGNIDLFILSGVLQYLEAPEEKLAELLETYRPPVLLLDRTFYHFEKTHRLTKQVVPSSIYNASYPCWFFNQERIDSIIARSYAKILEMPGLEDFCDDFPSVVKGQLWVRKESL